MLTEETKTKLRAVSAAILKNPLELDMTEWCGKSDVSPCGTTACIAGWALSLECGKDHPAVDSVWHRLLAPSEEAANALGLEYKQRERLFFVVNWPVLFADRYSAAPYGSFTRAQVVADRIQRFIDTEGEE